MKVILLAVVFAVGCASTQPRHLRPTDSIDREIAMNAYGFGALIAFGGCIAGFAGAGPVAVPICLGGWVVGVSGLVYLSTDDGLRSDSFMRSRNKYRP